MKVISIGPDKDLLKTGSVSFKRHLVYAKHFDEFHAIVFARRKYGKKSIKMAKNAWSHPTYSRNTVMLFIDAFRIGRKILREKGEWVISAQDPFESGLVAYCLARLTKTPFFVQLHGDFFSASHWRKESRINNLRWLVGRYILRRADTVRVVSDRVLKNLVSLGIDRNKIVKFPIYTDTTQFTNAKPDKRILSLKKEGVVILSMARFSVEKNLEMLLKSFADVMATGEKAYLILVGGGKEEKK